MAIFTVGLALAYVGCGSDEEDEHDHGEETESAEETVINVDGRQVVVLEGRLNADKVLTDCLRLSPPGCSVCRRWRNTDH